MERLRVVATASRAGTGRDQPRCTVTGKGCSSRPCPTQLPSGNRTASRRPLTREASMKRCGCSRVHLDGSPSPSPNGPPGYAKVPLRPSEHTGLHVQPSRFAGPAGPPTRQQSSAARLGAASIAACPAPAAAGASSGFGGRLPGEPLAGSRASRDALRTACRERTRPRLARSLAGRRPARSGPARPGPRGNAEGDSGRAGPAGPAAVARAGVAVCARGVPDASAAACPPRCRDPARPARRTRAGPASRAGGCPVCMARMRPAFGPHSTRAEPVCGPARPVTGPHRIPRPGAARPPAGAAGGRSHRRGGGAGGGSAI